MKGGTMSLDTLLQKVQLPCSNNTSQDVEISLVLGDVTVCYDEISACNLDHACTNIIIGVKDTITENLIQSGIPSIAGSVVNTSHRLFLSGTLTVFARFVGATLNDRLTVSVFGYYTENK
jgi:hypothetical protein